MTRFSTCINMNPLQLPNSKSAESIYAWQTCGLKDFTPSQYDVIECPYYRHDCGGGASETLFLFAILTPKLKMVPLKLVCSNTFNVGESTDLWDSYKFGVAHRTVYTLSQGFKHQNVWHKPIEERMLAPDYHIAWRKVGVIKPTFKFIPQDL